ncbi:hypothetical protein R0137_07965 [Congregibacter brevis]|uniref:Uncharacterized protein n=1 Tax=Congregibacter brevis TaxID=3081201 RepID=A0ABZ0IHE9_9GAMM|nr:hypothetical protein R0137_07965 [Congregibacter sp. IMCC45268]
MNHSISPTIARLVAGLILLTTSFVATGADLDSLIKQLQSKNITVETIAALVELDDPTLRMGYGLCEAAGQSLCKPDGSLGYGLCEVADGTLCKKNGSLGYGLCMLGSGKGCVEKGSLGYGLCELAGEKNCKP